MNHIHKCENGVQLNVSHDFDGFNVTVEVAAETECGDGVSIQVPFVDILDLVADYVRACGLPSRDMSLLRARMLKHSAFEKSGIRTSGRNQ